MRRSFFSFAALLTLLAGCSSLASPTQSPIPTPYPPEYLPTVIALTSQAGFAFASQTALALQPTVAPTETLEPTLTPLPQPTYTATSYPFHSPGAIRFNSPGPMSKVVSPIQLRMEVISGESQRVQIDLYGEDGRLLARELRKVPTTGKGALVSVRISFETRAAAELGRITVSTLDAEGRIQALNSIRVLLLSSGVNELNPVGNVSEPVLVYKPIKEDSIFDGVVNVRGDIWPMNLQPVILELVDAEGKSIALRVMTVNHLNPQIFETTLPYKVTEPTSVRLVIRQDDDRMPGVFYIYTREILLNP